MTVEQDAPDTVFSLYPYFQDVEDADAQLTYTVTGNTNPALFTAVNITDPTKFRLDYAPGASGPLTSLFGLPHTGGLFVEDTFHVTINPALNTAPTLTTPIPDVTVDEDAADTVFSLYPHFQDVEDADAALTYSVTGNTNPSLFTLVNFTDPNNFTLDYAPDANGIADITIGPPIPEVFGSRTRSMSP